MAVAAATEAYADNDHLTHGLILIRAERARMQAGLAERGFVTAPTQTNFLFFDCLENAASIAEKLRHKCILIKGWLEEPYLSWARVTVGLPQQNDAFLAALDSLTAEKSENGNADSTRQCNFTHGMMREAAMPKCFSPSKVNNYRLTPVASSRGM
jgi:histidinol-phosphate/aromatic aminotransferase/cobyric acid decarboxylase-like protein